MATRARFPNRTLVVMSAVLVLLLAGCGMTADTFGLAVEPVTEATVVRTVRYVEGQEEGPAYQVTLTVPDEWVGNFITRNTGNSVYFDYVSENGDPAPLFVLEALSFGQLWKQTSGYAGEQTSVRSTLNTYFVYRMPIDAYYSGLPVDTFEAITAQVPAVISTLAVQVAPEVTETAAQ